MSTPKNILVLGAGRSSSSMIRYFLKNAEQENWQLIVADMNLALAQEKVKNHPRGAAIQLDALNPIERRKALTGIDLVVSMLPAQYHVEVVKDCIELKINTITPSYISDEMKALDEAAQNAGIIVMNEIGVDPGIDHMSAKKVLDRLEQSGAKITQFESFTGGLLAPESDNNPWNYKFTWNPRNVVLAGQGSASKFIQEGQYKYIPYHKLFRRTEIIEVEGYGRFEGYANRDSLKYRAVYGLDNIPTIYRGTLRRVGFCRAWNMFVQLGATDDSYILEGSKNMTKRQFINSFLAYNPYDSVELKTRYYLRIEQDDAVWDKLVWLGIFEQEPLNLEHDMTPAQILQKILEEKWTLEPHDKDMIVMWHKFGFELNGKKRDIEASMVFIGEDQTYTAMSETVGLPIGICSKMILNGTIALKGVRIPIEKEIYEPVLAELEKYGVVFTEKDVI
jgi:saccharopine dehydrogenase-like NADP-dependent oxidoreductase